MKTEKVLAFDMGGTKIASALVEISGSEYRILDYMKSETPHKREEILAKILESAEFYRSKYTFKKIGLAVAGQVNPAGDTVISAPNIPELSGFKLGAAIARKTGIAVSLRNDVRCFALGEDRFGKYRNLDSAIFFAIGTGIGGAIKTNGKFYFGRHNIAGEFGHMVVENGGEPCGCGRKGCWEKYVGGLGVEKRYEKLYGEKKIVKDIVRDALLGSEKDEKLMLETGAYFAAGLINLLNILDPEIVIIGGSMVKEKSLMKFALPSIKREALPSVRKTKIAYSSLGDKAFLLGAAIG